MNAVHREFPRQCTSCWSRATMGGGWEGGGGWLLAQGRPAHNNMFLHVNTYTITVIAINSSFHLVNLSLYTFFLQVDI